MKVIWNNQVIAESDQTKVVENNHYFPPESVNKQFFEADDKQTFCPWKGKASYYNLVDNGEKANGAAWYYAEPKEAANNIKNHVAFDKSMVKIENS